jgi:hypothetical protein
MEAIAFEAKENLVKVYFVMELMSIDLRKLIFYEKVKLFFKKKFSLK